MILHNVVIFHLPRCCSGQLMAGISHEFCLFNEGVAMEKREKGQSDGLLPSSTNQDGVKCCPLWCHQVKSDTHMAICSGVRWWIQMKLVWLVLNHRPVQTSSRFQPWKAWHNHRTEREKQVDIWNMRHWMMLCNRLRTTLSAEC